MSTVNIFRMSSVETFTPEEAMEELNKIGKFQVFLQFINPKTDCLVQQPFTFYPKPHKHPHAGGSCFIAMHDELVLRIPADMSWYAEKQGEGSMPVTVGQYTCYLHEGEFINTQFDIKVDPNLRVNNIFETQQGDIEVVNKKDGSSTLLFERNELTLSSSFIHWANTVYGPSISVPAMGNARMFQEVADYVGVDESTLSTLFCKLVNSDGGVMSLTSSLSITCDDRYITVTPNTSGCRKSAYIQSLGDCKLRIDYRKQLGNLTFESGHFSFCSPWSFEFISDTNEITTVPARRVNYGLACYFDDELGKYEATLLFKKHAATELSLKIGDLAPINTTVEKVFHLEEYGRNNLGWNGDSLLDGSSGLIKDVLLFSVEDFGESQDDVVTVLAKVGIATEYWAKS